MTGSELIGAGARESAGAAPSDSNDTSGQPRGNKPSVDSVWRIHALVANSIERVDSKAWIVVTLTAGTVAAIYNLSDKGEPLGGLTGAPLYLFRVGATDIALAAVLALLVVFPALDQKKEAWYLSLIHKLPPRWQAFRCWAVSHGLQHTLRESRASSTLDTCTWIGRSPNCARVFVVCLRTTRLRRWRDT